MDSEEIWKDIPGYDGVYQASNLGNIRSAKLIRGRARFKGRVLKKIITPAGYVQVNLSGKVKLAHRVIMSAFIGDSDLPVNHINDIKDDNRLENLEYITDRENVFHSKRNEKHRLTGTTYLPKAGKWQAAIRKNGSRIPIYLGCFDTQEDAHRAYLKELGNESSKYIKTIMEK